MNMYDLAKQEYKAIGIDTDAAIECLKHIPVSIHCWQGDDVIGLDGGGSLSGGIQTTESRYKKGVFLNARQKAAQPSRKLRNFERRTG